MSNENVKPLPYEAMFICPADIPQKDIDGIMEKLKKTLVEAGASVTSVQNWGRRRLSYPIKRHREGIYLYADFAGSNSCAAVLTNFFRVTDKVIRHLIVRKDEKAALAAQAAQAAISARTAGSSGNAPADKGEAPAAAPQAPKSKEIPSTK